MKKPNLEDVLNVLKMKDKANKLYDEIDEIVTKMKEEFGAGRFDYDLNESDAPYLKFEIVDNVQELLQDKIVWKSVALKPVSFSSGRLKRIPSSLK